MGGCVCIGMGTVWEVCDGFLLSGRSGDELVDGRGGTVLVLYMGYGDRLHEDAIPRAGKDGCVLYLGEKVTESSL